MKKRHLFQLYGSEVSSGTEDKRPNIITKNVPIAPIVPKIPGILEVLSQELWMKHKYI